MTAMLATIEEPQLHLQEIRDSDGYFLDYVTAQLPSVLADLHQDVVVLTTLEPAIQTAADQAVKNALENEDAAAKGAEHGALIAYGPDGGIVAMVGGRSYQVSQFNRSTQARRQPGSAFKPFIYAAALEAGFDQQTVLIDQPIQVEGWQPTNYKERFLGPIRLREALARSANTATVQITEATGRENVIDMARRTGLISNLQPHPSLALGSFEVPLDELTAAYLPFAHRGAALQTYAIREIRSRSGEVLYAQDASQPEQVISERTAERMTDLLHSVTTGGTGRSARVPSHEVAGKTGTTNEWRDAWFVGYSAHLTAGVWVGNDAYEPMEEVSGATYPARIWRDFMVAAHDAAGFEPTRLPRGESATSDPDLWQLTGTYATLMTDLQRHTRGASGYVEQRRRGIKSLYGLIRRETVVGRVATGEPSGG